MPRKKEQEPTNRKETFKEEIDRHFRDAAEYKRDQKAKAKVTQEVVKINVDGKIKEKYIQIKTWPDGTIERKVVGLKKNGKIIFDKGIKK